MENVNKLQNIDLKVDVIDTNYDVIVGYESIKREPLIQQLLMQRWGQQSNSGNRAVFLASNCCGVNPSDNSENRVAIQLSNCYGESQSASVSSRTNILVNDYSGPTSKAETEGVREHEVCNLCLRPEGYRNQDCIVMISAETENQVERNETIEAITLAGDEKLQQTLRALCLRHRKVFSFELNKNPARIKPMEIELSEAWKPGENVAPARLQSLKKEEEINLQVAKMLEAGIIRESQADRHSQVLMTPKSDGTWRFCIDFRLLNAKTKSHHWPLPRIKQMLMSLGRKRAKYFAVIDLTKGYFQAPLAEASKRLTAFITPNGVYEWNRVAMGLTGAPSYFQRAMTTEVLHGLIHSKCEVYLDDIIIFGASQDDFITNVREVLVRLQERNVTVNPKKCIFGVELVEYVGHVIDVEGTHFSREKLAKVIRIARPQTGKQMKSFLGFANYFRDHVKSYSDYSARLSSMITPYQPRATLTWDDEQIRIFDAFKVAINECPKLFFVDTDSPVHLYTDASLIGIGGYLCQIKDGIETPIAFYSKVLTTTEKKWGIPCLEAYAIYRAFQEFDYILRDAYTYVHTDHRNLIYIKDSTNEKIIRWKLKLQEYRFEVDAIRGIDNPIADFMSRNEAAEEDEEEDITTRGMMNMLCSLIEVKSWPDLNSIQQCNASYDNFIIPNEAYEKIESVHNDLVGHHGREVTVQKLSMKYDKWKYMRNHVQKFIHECDFCQKASYDKQSVVVPKFITGSYLPFERVNIDSIGPLTEDVDGYKHIICIVDCFSRFMTLFATKTTSAIEAAEALLKHCGYFGFPSQLLSDRGSQFVNVIIKEFLELAGTEQLMTLSYSKQENSIVERANKEVGRWLRAMLYHDKLRKNKWSKFLPFVERIHNASVISTTGHSPAQIIFGDRVELNRNILLPKNERLETNESLSEWMSERKTYQDKVIEAAQSLQRKHEQEHCETNLEREDLVSNFEIGSYVLVAYPDTNYGQGRPSKLHTMLRGPYKVVDKVRNEYKVQNLVTNRVETKSVFLLREFHYDATRTDPLTIALKDYEEEYLVESIEKHNGSWKNIKNMRFLVKWVGFEERTWEPYSNLKNNEQLRDYVINMGHSHRLDK